MANLSDMANVPLDFVINGKTYKIKRLSIRDIFLDFEKEIKEKYMQNVMEMSKLIDSKDKMEYLRKAMVDMPSGRRLDDMVQEEITSISGGTKVLIKALNTCQKVTEQEVMQMSMDANNSDTLAQIITYCLGGNIEEEKKTNQVEQNQVNQLQEIAIGSS